MNADRLAHYYRWCEWAAFGPALERRRFHFLDSAPLEGNALLLGEGDGRFLVALARARPLLRIRSVEISRAMVDVAIRRVRIAGISDPSRIDVEQADMFATSFPSDAYDLVVTNFVFDCFDEAAVGDLIARVVPSTRPGSLWFVSEFQQPAYGWRRWHAVLWLSVMYTFFRWTTGLRTRQLPNYRALLQAAHFGRVSNHTSRSGLMTSELWRRT